MIIKKTQVQIRKSTNLGRVPSTNYLRLTIVRLVRRCTNDVSKSRTFHVIIGTSLGFIIVIMGHNQGCDLSFPNDVLIMESIVMSEMLNHWIFFRFQVLTQRVLRPIVKYHARNTTTFPYWIYIFFGFAFWVPPFKATFLATPNPNISQPSEVS